MLWEIATGEMPKRGKMRDLMCVYPPPPVPPPPAHAWVSAMCPLTIRVAANLSTLSSAATGLHGLLLVPPPLF